MKILVKDTIDGVLVFDESNQRLYGNQALVPDFRGSFEEEMTVEDAKNRLKVVQDGQLKGHLYYD